MKLIALKRSILLIILGIVVFCFSVGGSTPAFASSFSKKIETSVELKGASEVKVVQTHRISWDDRQFIFPANKNFAYAYIFPAFANQSATILEHVSNISVRSRFADPATLTFTKTLSDGAIQLKIPYYEDLDADNSLEFVVSYTTDLYVLTEGGITELTYPGLHKDFTSRVSRKGENYDEITTYSLNLIIPTNFGELSAVSPSPTSQKATSGKTTLTYGVPALVGKSVRISLGTERKVKFALTGQTYATNMNTPDFVKDLLVNYVDIALPTQQLGTEFANQTVYYSKIEPFPTKLWVDADGNLIARLPVSAAHEGKITIEGYAIIRRGVPASNLEDVKIGEIPVSMATYLNSDPRFWQVDSSSIQSAAAEIKSQGELEVATVRKTMDYVTNELSYPEAVTEESLFRQGAEAALQSKIGVCMEYSDLMLSLLRAKRIPARAVYGDGIGSRVDRTLEGIGHQWVGFWLPEGGWIPADPTWSDEGREYIGHDVDHFVWYVASVSPNEPSGFNCKSLDGTSPCREALRIDTTPVDAIPDVKTLLTITQLQEKVGQDTARDQGFIARAGQQAVVYLGATSVGRVLLSKQGMLVTFALVLYVILVSIVAIFSKLLRKSKQPEKARRP